MSCLSLNNDLKLSFVYKSSDGVSSAFEITSVWLLK